MKTQNQSFIIYCVLVLLIPFIGAAQETEDQEVKNFQFSFVPPVSSNGPQNEQMINRFSLNLLAGYSYGVEAFEFGGLYNLVKADVRGGQISGFGNTVGGETRGLQLAGFFNTNKGYVEGAQIAGFANQTGEDVKGLQLGGFGNYNKGEVEGAQVAGFINLTGSGVNGLQMGGFMNQNKGAIEGAQVAGFLNVTNDKVTGLQLGGFSNISSETKGFQIAGFNNHNKKTDGTQISGFINTTGDLDGAQLAGFVNVAKGVKGVQIGVINVADSVGSGVQVGLVNISRKNGFISPAVEWDDTEYFRVIFRSGLDKFYGLLSAGINVDENWSYGAGFGSRLFLSKKKTTFFNPELRYHNINRGRLKFGSNNHLVKLNLNMGYQILKNFYITSGPSVNLYVSNRLDRNGRPVIDLANNPSWDHRSGRSRYQLWVGYTVGIGF